MRWVVSGSCRQVDPEMFFPNGASERYDLEVALAKSVCRGCPVVHDCLAWAVESDQGDGIWGGMTRRERRAYVRARTSTAASETTKPAVEERRSA